MVLRNLLRTAVVTLASLALAQSASNSSPKMADSKLPLAEGWTLQSSSKIEADGEAIVSLLAKRIGETVARRLIRGNVMTDTVPDQPKASVCA